MQLLLAVDLLEHGDVVVTLAPDELLVALVALRLGVGVEERPALGLELLDGGLVGHVVHPLVAADAT